MSQPVRGMAAYRAWRSVPRTARRRYLAGTATEPEYASAALGYATLAMTPLGFALYLGPAVLILFGVSIAMAAIGIGPDTTDVLIFVGLLVVNHVRAASRVGKAARRITG